MKKLGKLNINPERVMTNEELLSLRGGYGVHYCGCRNDADETICASTLFGCADGGCETWCGHSCPGMTNTVCVGD